MSTSIVTEVVRTLLLMGLGTAGMVNEMFLHPPPDLTRCVLYIGMILGEATWQAVGIERRRSNGSLPTAGPSSSPPAPSSSSAPGSSSSGG